MFAGMKVYIYPQGIPRQRIKKLAEIITARSGSVVDHLKNANLVVSSGNRDVPSIAPDWVSECVRLGHLVDPKDWRNTVALNIGVQKAEEGAHMGKNLGSGENKHLLDFAAEEKLLATRDTSKRIFEQDTEPEVNQLIVSQLQKLQQRYLAVGDKFRTSTYKAAIESILNHPVQLTTAKEALKLYRVGPSIAKKIEEIHEHGSLQLNRSEPPEIAIILRFMDVYGIGPAKAKQFYKEGCRTLGDIKRRTDLTSQQLAGLDNVDPFNIRIPRSEVQDISKNVLSVCEKVMLQCDPASSQQVDVCTGGSYRRGELTCGDVDLILTSTSGPPPGFLELLIKELTRSGFMTHTLAIGNSSFRGICALEGCISRRVDVWIVPMAEIGAAMVQFTGDTGFNRGMRYLARLRGMKLNQRGLYERLNSIHPLLIGGKAFATKTVTDEGCHDEEEAEVLRDCHTDSKGGKTEIGKWIAGATEQEVFDALGNVG